MGVLSGEHNVRFAGFVCYRSVRIELDNFLIFLKWLGAQYIHLVLLKLSKLINFLL